MIRNRGSWLVPPFVALFLLLAVAGRHPMLGAHEITLLARPELGTLHGMRAISRYDDGTYGDLSANGMYVGTGPGEVRVVACKPAFGQVVEAYRRWTVVDVAYAVAGTSATLSAPLQYWSGVTPDREVFSLPRTDITTRYLMDLFQTQLRAGGNYARTTGVVVVGIEPLQDANPVELTFAVTVRDPSTFTVEGLSLAAGQSGLVVFAWRSSRRGHADIFVNGVERVRDQFTVAERINRNTLWADWLQTGSNEVYVRVTEPTDMNSTAQSAVLTLTR